MLAPGQMGCTVQVLGLVKDVQTKSGKLYKEWLK